MFSMTGTVRRWLLAAELGSYYAARETNTHAKAGNLHNALLISDGEFIVTLDADHVPLPNFIDKTLGHFEDKAVAFVQTPQVFYNLDSFQHRFDPKAEEDVDRTVAFFCGNTTWEGFLERRFLLRELRNNKEELA